MQPPGCCRRFAAGRFLSAVTEKRGPSSAGCTFLQIIYGDGVFFFKGCPLPFTGSLQVRRRLLRRRHRLLRLHVPRGQGVPRPSRV